MNKITNNTRRTLLKTVGASSLMTFTTAGASYSLAQNTPSQYGYNFDNKINRVGVNSIKWDGAIAQYGEGIIKVPMTIADMDFQQMPEVKAAFLKRINYESYGYETPPKSYFDAIIKWNKDQYGLDIKEEWIRKFFRSCCCYGTSYTRLKPCRR